MKIDMKIFKDRVDNFFKWVKGTELVELDYIDVAEDPVRPELGVEFRLNYDRKIFGLKYEDNIEGIICVAYTNDVPHNVKELDLMSQNAHYKQDPNTAVAYTVWSRKRGAGKEIVKKLSEHCKKISHIEKLVTLSPLTPMATHFHISNGAKLISINHTSQNFEYKLSS
jgi:hypothetical protein